MIIVRAREADAGFGIVLLARPAWGLSLRVAGGAARVQMGDTNTALELTGHKFKARQALALAVREPRVVWAAIWKGANRSIARANRHRCRLLHGGAADAVLEVGAQRTAIGENAVGAVARAHRDDG